MCLFKGEPRLFAFRRLVNPGWDEGVSEEVKEGLLGMRRRGPGGGKCVASGKAPLNVDSGFINTVY